MTRKEMRAIAKRLAPVMAALNSPVVEAGDPLAALFAVLAGAKMVMPKITDETVRKLEGTLKTVQQAEAFARNLKKARTLETTLERQWELLEKWQNNASTAPPALLAKLLPPLKPSRLNFRPLDGYGRPQEPQEASKPVRGLQQSTARFREWVEMCATGKIAKLHRRLKSHRFSATDKIAAWYLRRIIDLGVYRCEYCRKLTLNTSGHADRKFCTGTNCASNRTHARIMAARFAKVQAEKIQRVKAAIAESSGTGDLKRWIAEHAGVTLRWVTEAARRGDVRLPMAG